ncbi:RNA exonuclease 4 [Genypterus blacodes]|uniref:RNA exonuclease 4 n=1 Tax=Genypterus blacodes TaxID=154954 RepID=UPI003F7710C1
MAKVKAKKPDGVKTKQSGAKNGAKKKRKEWMKEKFRKKKPPAPKQEKEKAKPEQPSPPVDAQQFSANWKKLQEIIKSSPAEKKQPVVLKRQNGAPGKGKPWQKASPKQGDAGKTASNKSEGGSVAPKDSEVNAKCPAGAQKRKKEQGDLASNDKKRAKKQKPVVEETKVTEADMWFDDVDPDDIEATVGAEAADIMRKKQGVHKSTTQDTESALVKDRAFEGLTRAVAIDCEMVGVGPDGEDSILARVSLVNHFGKCIYDKYVKPTERVTDYRTAVSGIRPQDIKDGEDVQTVQREVGEILGGRIVVGHAIHNDLKILLLDHPKKKIRDTQKYKPFKKTVKSGRPSLKLLCREILNVKVQQGEHSSVQDAQATMRLYTMAKKQWEAEIKARHTMTESDKKKERKPKNPRYKGRSQRGL